MSTVGHNSGTRWIALSIDARFHPVIGCGRAVRGEDETRDAWSRFEAWIDLICEASWKNREVINKGRTILLERSELMVARGWLAKRWNWTEKQVRLFVDRLEAESMVETKEKCESDLHPKTVLQKGQHDVLEIVRQKGQQKNNLVRVISICNYDLYQTARELNELLEGQRNDKQKAQQKDQQKGKQRASEGPDPYLVYKGDTNPLLARARMRTREDYDFIRDKLLVATSPAVDEAHPNILQLTEPVNWLDNGCDLGLDVLPTLQRIASRKKPREINNWGFFRKAVAEARDKRLRPMPPGINGVYEPSEISAEDAELSKRIRRQIWARGEGK